MKRFTPAVAVVTLLAFSAWAGETLLGVIVVTDGGTGTNKTAGATAAAPTTFINGTRCNAGFDIGPNAKLTVQTDEGCFVGANVTGCDAGQCLSLAANEKFPTSVGPNISMTGSAWNWDGGSQSTPCVVTAYTGWIAVSPPLGGAACHAKVFQRSGTE